MKRLRSQRYKPKHLQKRTKKEARKNTIEILTCVSLLASAIYYLSQALINWINLFK